MKKLWFVSKRYGWGWTPATWQGWTITLGYIALMLATAFGLAPYIEENDIVLFPVVFFWVSLTCLLLWICYKTGEKPRWRWGD